MPRREPRPPSPVRAPAERRRTSRDTFDRDLRLLIFERDGWQCQLCGVPVRPEWGHRDSGVAGHIVAVIDGGQATLANGRTECMACSTRLGASHGNRRGFQRWEQTQAELRAAHAEVQRLTTELDNTNRPATTTTPPHLEAATEHDDEQRNHTDTAASAPQPETDTDHATPTEIPTQDHNAAGPPIFLAEPHLPTRSLLPVLTPGGVSGPGRLRESRPEDFAGVPWLTGLLEVPDDAVWPRFMSPPHPDAVGSFGASLVQSAADRAGPGGRGLDWWQRLVAARVLEHDEAGRLCWLEWLLTVARQLGKSWLIRELALWRVRQAERIGEPQEVLHVANKLGIADAIQAGAREWALRRVGWSVKRAAGEKRVSYGESNWLLSAPRSVYGRSCGLGIVDEGWDIPAEHVDSGMIPTMLERVDPQVALISTAHHLATALMVDRRHGILEGSVPSLILEWSAQPWRSHDDRGAWRSASPRWTPQRERLVEAALIRALSDRVTPDPLAVFRSQYLNIWPSSIRTTVGRPGLPLLVDEMWPTLEGDAETDGPVAFAAEDVAGRAVAVAAASRAADGRIVVQAFTQGGARAVWEWFRVHGGTRPGSSVRVGPALARLAESADIGLPIEVGGSGDTRAGLSLLRQLVSRRGLAHYDSPVLAGQLEELRVLEGSAGLRVVSTEPWELVRAAGWALLDAEAARSGAPVIW